MKYYVGAIIGLCIFFYCEGLLVTYGSGFLSTSEYDNVVYELQTHELLLSGTVSYNSDSSTGFADGPYDDLMKLGDLEIQEIFPGSGSCLDEHIIILARRDFSGYIDILGAGTSSGIVTVRIDVYSGEQIIITDNIAGIKTTKQIFLIPSITLTNGGEVLQLLYSGLLIDDVLYSDPRSPKSLIFTESVLGKRFFKTIKDPYLQAYCSDLEFVITGTNNVGGCSLAVSDYQNSGSGNVSLNLSISYLSGCLEGSSNKRFDGGMEFDVNVCQTSIQINPGMHHLQYFGYSNTGMLICSDELYFAFQYDVGYIQSQKDSPGQCQSAGVHDTASAKPIILFDSKNCGIELQSPRVGYTLDNALNVRVLIDGTGLTNSQTKYSCKVDFGNGESIEECNPSSFYYKLPGIYTIGIDIKDRNSGQKICSHTSFFYVPPPLIAKMTNLKSNQLEDDVLHSSLYCSGVLSSLYVYSLLPNPKGSDSGREEVILHQLSGDVDLSQFILKIGKKNFLLSGEFVSQKLVLQNNFGLLNKGMCFELTHKKCGLAQRVCYDIIKDDEVVYCVQQNDVTCTGFGVTANATNGDLNSNSCVDKINTLKKDHKNSLAVLREKQKTTLLKLRSDYKLSIQKYRDKERISRNSLYVRERSFQIIYNALVNGESSILLFTKDILNVNNDIIANIENKYYYLYQTGKSTIYMYDIKKFITNFITSDSVLLYFLPELYFDVLDYQITMENS